MARTLRTSYDHRRRSARDGAVRNWETRGRRTRGEVAAHRAARQAARAEVAAWEAEEAFYAQQEVERRQQEEAFAALDAQERELQEFLAEERRHRARLVEEFGEYSDEVYLFDNPAYAKWLERQLFARESA